MSTNPNPGCYFIIKGLDDVLAKKYGNISSSLMSGYRSLYEDKTGRSASLDDEDKIFELIKSSVSENIAEARRREQAIINSSESIIYKRLIETFSPFILNERINMIARLFSARVSEYQASNPEFTREEIISKQGAGNLISDVKQFIDGLYAAAVKNKNTYKAEEFKKVIANWDALVYRAQAVIKQYEGVNLSQGGTLVVASNSSNFNENDLEVIYNIEESTRESWQTNKDHESSYGRVGQDVRRAISRIVKYAGNGVVERDDLGIVKTLSPIKVHQTLVDLFRNVTSSSQMMEVLRKYAQENKWAEGIVKQLDSNLYLRTQFFVDLYSNFQMYSIIYTENGVSKTKILNLESSASQLKKYLANINIGNFPKSSIFKVGEDGTVKFDMARVKEIYESITYLFTKDQNEVNEYNLAVASGNAFGKPVPQIGINKNRNLKVPKLVSLLNDLGITTDAEQVINILNNGKDSRKLYDQLLDLKYAFKEINDYSVNAAKFIEENKIFSEKMLKIFRVTSKYNNGLAMDNRIRYKGNTYYSNVTPSFLGDFIGFINNCSKNNDIDSLKEFLRNKYLNCSTFLTPSSTSFSGMITNTWLEELNDSDLNDENSFANKIAWKKLLGVGDIDFEDLSENLHIKTLMTEFNSDREVSGNPDIEYVNEEELNKRISEKRDDKSKLYHIEGTNSRYKWNKTSRKWEKETRRDYAWYPTFVLGDANVAKFIRARRYSSKEIIEGMYKIYVAELQRQINTSSIKEHWDKNEIAYNESMIKNANLFKMLPFLNKSYKDGKYYNIASKSSDARGWLPSSVKEAISEYLKDSSQEFINKIGDKKIIDKSNTKEVMNAVDFFYNTSFATLQQLQLMTIDVAFYKDIKDLQKRYKEIHAPGSKLDISAVDVWNGNKPLFPDGKAIERVIYFNEVKVNSETNNPSFFEAIKSKFGSGSWIVEQYKKNKSTDGQAYRSFSSYRKVLIMSGKWNAAYERAYNTLMEIRNSMKSEGRKTMTKEELNRLDDCRVAFQPLKPYYYGFETIQGSNQLIPVQHKYAEVPLIPELLPENSPLRELAEYMEENSIDLAGSTEIAKVGGYGQVSINENMKENLPKAVVHELDYSNLRIQTNVPNHVYEARLFGTQLRKLIMSGLKRDNYADYINGKGVTILDSEGEVNLTKTNLTRFYNSLIVANILDSYKIFAEKTGNVHKLSQSAIYQIINNDREIKDNVYAMSVNEFGKFITPLFEGGIEHDAAATMFSIFKKLVNKQSILGGSAVQVSDFGITNASGSKSLQWVTETKDGKTNVLYAECEIPFNFSYKDSKGNEVPLKFSDYCNPDGTFILQDGKPKIEVEFPGILDIIAYRVPTERAYSMLNLKVVRCSHPMAGGTMRVPAEGPTISGFDFDIDKLYFMRKEFRQKSRYERIHNSIPKAVLYDIWAKVYDMHPDIKRALESERREGDTTPLNQFWDSTTLPLSYDKNQLFEEAADELGIDLGKYEDTTIEINSFEEYDTTKSPFQQSTAARNNMLIELCRKRLSDYETFEERLTPGGFRNASTAAKLMRVLTFGDSKKFILDGKVLVSKVMEYINSDKFIDPEPEYDPSNPMTIVTYNKQNQIASKLIGIFANHNTHHAFISSLKACSLNLPISFGSHPEGLKDLIGNKSGVDASLSMAEYLAASVDAVKDPVLNFLNLNTITADTGALLARLGYSFEEIGLLFNQPIIKRLCEYCFDNNLSDLNDAIITIASEYGVSDISKISVNPEALSNDKLAYEIVNGGAPEIQLMALKTFKEAAESAKDLSAFILNSKFTASNSTSSTFGGAFEKRARLQEFVANLPKSKLHIEVTDIPNAIPIKDSVSGEFGSLDYVSEILRNPLAYEQVMSDSNDECLEHLGMYVPYNNPDYVEARRALSSFSKYPLDGNTIDDIHRDIPVYILSNDENSYLHPLGSSSFGKSNKEYSIEVFPKKLFTYLKENDSLQLFSLFKYLSLTEIEGRPYIAPQDTGGVDNTDIDIIRAELMDLWRNSDTKWIVEGLFDYSFFTVGFNFNHNSLINLFPTQFKSEYVVAEDYDGNPITYTEYLELIHNKKKGFNTRDFAEKFIRNHPDNDKLVYTAKGKISDILSQLVQKSQEAGSDEIVVDEAILGKRIYSLILNSSEEGVAFKPFLKIGDSLYQAFGVNGNISNEKSITYRKVSILGNTVDDINYVDDSPSTGRPIVSKRDATPKEYILGTEEANREIDRIFEERFTKDFLPNIQKQLEYNFDNGERDFSSKAEIAEYIERVKEEYLKKDTMTKWESLKSKYPDAVKNFRDDEGHPFCS